MANRKVERIFNLVERMPKLSLKTLVDPVKKPEQEIYFYERDRYGHNSAAARQRAHDPLGVRPGLNVFEWMPYYRHFKKNNFNANFSSKLHYIPLSMARLQLLIDTNRVDPEKPIDVAALCRSGFFQLKPENLHGGIMLTDEGVDIFKAKVNIEVQCCPEATIAAIEKNGGTVTTAYYDPVSLTALNNPIKFFEQGVPIPKRLLPKQSILPYYTNPENRGYLADPDEVAKQRFVLSQKFGYSLGNLKEDSKYEMLSTRKDPRQIFYGLQPGWVVNLADKEIIKPTDPSITEYYNS